MASPSASGIGLEIPKDSLHALPINVMGMANIDYRINVRSGNNVSVYLIDQDQLTSLENGSAFTSYSDWNFLDVSQASRTGNLTTGSYYLVIVNGLTANSTGSVTLDYHMNVGGQMSQMTIIGWIWSVIALASMMGVAVGIYNINRVKQPKKVRSRRSNSSK